MCSKVSQFLIRLLLLLTVAALAAARPQQFLDNQVTGEQQGGNEVYEPLPAANPAIIPRIEMLARLLQAYDALDKNSEVVKRQSRYRQCYFNPISCFRK